MITLECKQQGKASVVVVVGRMELTSMGRFQEAFKELVPPGTPVILDLGGVTHIDSSGVSGLVGLHQRTRDFFLLEPAHAVDSLLRMANLDRYFKILTRPELERKFPAD